MIVKLIVKLLFKRPLTSVPKPEMLALGQLTECIRPVSGSAGRRPGSAGTGKSRNVWWQIRENIFYLYLHCYGRDVLWKYLIILNYCGFAKNKARFVVEGLSISSPETNSQSIQCDGCIPLRTKVYLIP